MKQTSTRIRANRRMMTALGAAGGVFLAAFLAAPAAHAQQKGELGQQGTFIISADRLFQLFAYDNVSQDDITFGGLPAGTASETTTQNQTSFSFLYGSTASQLESFFTVPRVGFDYVLVPNVTLGGDLILVLGVGGSTKHETDFSNGSNNTTSTSNPGVTGFGIAPRGGYILALTDTFSLWLRGGFSFYTASTKTTETVAGNSVTTSLGENQLALDLEPQIVYTPIPHVGFTAGLTADIPLTGGHSEETDTGNNTQTASAHSSIFYMGLELGMLTHF